MKTARFLTSRLASKAGTHSAELHVRADSAGDAIRLAILGDGRNVPGVLDVLLNRMRPGVGNFAPNHEIAIAYLRHLPTQIWQALRAHIAAMLLDSHHEAAGAMLRTLPKSYLRAAVANRLTESKQAKLLEHGPISFSVQPTPLPTSPWWEPGAGPSFTTEAPVLSAGAEEDMWRDFLFPPPSADRVRSILDTLLPPRHVQGNLFDVIGPDDSTGLTPPSLAMKIATLYSEGRSTQEVSRQVRPYFEGSAMRAERSARTLGAYVGTERNLATSEALGDLVLGYQVHSAGGENARHNHAMRSGTVYYREPKGNQVGIEKMPHPPVDEGSGPYDGPKGTQWNCRCWITPVLRPLAAMDSAAFVDNADKLIPDPAHFADWFEKASPQQRAKAAGVRRLQAAADKWGFTPTWTDLVDPETGKLLSVEQIKRESNEAWTARKAAVWSSITMNRELVKRVAAFGTV